MQVTRALLTRPSHLPKNLLSSAAPSYNGKAPIHTEGYSFNYHVAKICFKQRQATWWLRSQGLVYPCTHSVTTVHETAFKWQAILRKLVDADVLLHP